MNIKEILILIVIIIIIEIIWLFNNVIIKYIKDLFSYKGILNLNYYKNK